MIPGGRRMDLLIVLLLAVLPIYGCDEAVTLESQWRTVPITIDGDGAEWPDTRQYFEKKSNVLISVMNDDDNIYVRLLMRSKETQRMFLQAGFITWIDDTGGSEKKFGVQFPLAKENPMQGNMPDYKQRNSMQEVLEDSLQSLSVLDTENSPARSISMAEAAEKGIYACLGMTPGYMVYELQVPIKAAAENKLIGIGFETGKVEKPSEREPPRGGGEMRSGMGGPPPPRGGGGGRPSGGGPAEPFAMWATVQLVENPIASHEVNQQD